MTHGAVCTGVIGGIVSFCLLHAVEWILDWGSSRTNGAFGSTTPAIAPDAHHGINPKDSAHEMPKPNGKSAVDEEVRHSCSQAPLLHTDVERCRRPGWDPCRPCIQACFRSS